MSECTSCGELGGCDCWMEEAVDDGKVVARGFVASVLARRGLLPADKRVPGWLAGAPAVAVAAGLFFPEHEVDLFFDLLMRSEQVQAAFSTGVRSGAAPIDLFTMVIEWRPE